MDITLSQILNAVIALVLPPLAALAAYLYQHLTSRLPANVQAWLAKQATTVVGGIEQQYKAGLLAWDQRKPQALGQLQADLQRAFPHLNISTNALSIVIEDAVQALGHAPATQPASTPRSDQVVQIPTLASVAPGTPILPTPVATALGAGTSGVVQPANTNSTTATLQTDTTISTAPVADATPTATSVSTETVAPDQAVTALPVSDAATSAV